MKRRYAQRIGQLAIVLVLCVALFHLFVTLYVGRSVPPTPSTLPADFQNLYFAYGANMSSTYLANVRNVHPIGRSVGRLEGYKLTFGIKGPNSVEPGFATIQPALGESVEGVVYALSDDDFGKIIGSEPDQYGIKRLPVALPDGRVVHARTLVAPEEGVFTPSSRYVKIMIHGARDAGLSTEYLQKLQGLETAYTPVLSEIMGTVVYTVVFVQSY